MWVLDFGFRRPARGSWMPRWSIRPARTPPSVRRSPWPAHAYVADHIGEVPEQGAPAARGRSAECSRLAPESVESMAGTDRNSADRPDRLLAPNRRGGPGTTTPLPPLHLVFDHDLEPLAGLGSAGDLVAFSGTLPLELLRDRYFFSMSGPVLFYRRTTSAWHDGANKRIYH